MPEGHTIHRIARDHGRDFTKQRLKVLSPQGRFATEAGQLSGGSLRRVEAYGKHLFYVWTRGRVIHVHLGLYGKFRHHTAPPPEPRGAVRLRVIGKSRAFDLNGPNVCDLVSTEQHCNIIDRLGPDPLRSDADAERAISRIKRSRAAIGALLLNQSVIAGVGNVYRAEALFKLGIHPDRPGKSLSTADLETLWELLVSDLAIGVKYNRIITADPAQVGKPRSRMNRGERLLIYKRPECQTCGSVVSYWILGARTIYACETCQS